MSTYFTQVIWIGTCQKCFAARISSGGAHFNLSAPKQNHKSVCVTPRDAEIIALTSFCVRSRNYIVVVFMWRSSATPRTIFSSRPSWKATALRFSITSLGRTVSCMFLTSSLTKIFPHLKVVRLRASSTPSSLITDSCGTDQLHSSFAARGSLQRPLCSWQAWYAGKATSAGGQRIPFVNFSHRSRHRTPRVGSYTCRDCNEAGLLLKDFDPQVHFTWDQYWFAGGWITQKLLGAIKSQLTSAFNSVMAVYEEHEQKMPSLAVAELSLFQ